MEENPPVRVYDTSGVWADPDVKCDVREGLPTLRREWVLGRGDVEEYEGREILPQDNGYLTKGAEDVAKIKDTGKLEEFPALQTSTASCETGHECFPDALCKERDRYTRDGVCRDSREFGQAGSI